MTLSTEEAVRETFLLATRQSLAKSLRTAEDFERFAAIAKETEARLVEERDAFQRDYDLRLADARQIILRERTGLRLDQPRPRDAPNPTDRAALDAKADARVRLDHRRRVAAIHTDELDRYRELDALVRARDQKRGHARDAFARTQTRSGPSRD